jgi:hypothetical protein
VVATKRHRDRRARLNKRGYTLLGSCRWLAKPVGVNALDDLYAAGSVLGPKAAQTQLAIFSKNGFSEALRTRAETEDVHLIDVDDLFA